MTIPEMLQQSTVLAIFGMTVVFVFLCIMIVCVNLTGKLIRKMGWDRDIEQRKNKPPAKSGGTVSPEIIAAISTVIAEYQKKSNEK
jgi:oxaloacetate decarboxylase gamma subunit